MLGVLGTSSNFAYETNTGVGHVPVLSDHTQIHMEAGPFSSTFFVSGDIEQTNAPSARPIRQLECTVSKPVSRPDRAGPCFCVFFVSGEPAFPHHSCTAGVDLTDAVSHAAFAVINQHQPNSITYVSVGHISNTSGQMDFNFSTSNIAEGHSQLCQAERNGSKSESRLDTSPPDFPPLDGGKLRPTHSQFIRKRKSNLPSISRSCSMPVHRHESRRLLRG